MKKGNRVIVSYSWCSENKMNGGMYPIDIAWNSSPKSVKKKNLTEACGVLGIELESYRRIVNALNCWSMSPALDIFQQKCFSLISPMNIDHCNSCFSLF